MKGFKNMGLRLLLIVFALLLVTFHFFVFGCEEEESTITDNNAGSEEEAETEATPEPEMKTEDEIQKPEVEPEPEFKDALTDEVNREGDSKQRGNTAGNIANLGLAAKQGDWLYYSNGSQGYNIYRVNVDGNGREQVSEDSSF